MKSDTGTGISNRETPSEEAAERKEFPPIRPTDAPVSGHELKVPGAFGKGEPEPEDQAGTSHPGKKTKD